MARAPILTLLLFLVNVSPCSAEAPALFREPAFNAATLAETVNHFVAIGEEATVQELTGLSLGRDYVEVYPTGKLPPEGIPVPWLKVSERIGWVCRILFTPKGREPLRPPLYGALYLPDKSMPLRRWPLYPVARSGRSYFVLSQGYSGEGVPENPMDYVDYCRKNGTFRSRSVPVPPREQALKDAAALRHSHAWKAIRWPNSSPQESTKSTNTFIGAFIQAQAEASPLK